MITLGTLAELRIQTERADLLIHKRNKKLVKVDALFLNDCIRLIQLINDEKYEEANVLFDSLPNTVMFDTSLGKRKKLKVSKNK